MPSHYFRIEVFGVANYGCADFDLMGYNDMAELLDDCWDKYYSHSSVNLNNTTGDEK